MELAHRYFVQHLLHNSIFTKEAAFQYYLLLQEKVGNRGELHDDTSFKKFIDLINAEISKQFFKLVFFRCEVTGKELLMFINMTLDESSKAQDHSSKQELEYFHVVMHEILRSNERRITFVKCLNLASTSFTMGAGQNAMEKWLKQGYYVKDLDYIYLGPMLISEYTGYLRKRYPDNTCSLCSELVFTGKTCGSCHIITHFHCMERCSLALDRCPSCQTESTEQSSFTQENTQESLVQLEESGNESRTSLRNRRRLTKQ